MTEPATPPAGGVETFDAAPMDPMTRTSTIFFVAVVLLVTGLVTFGSGETLAYTTIPLAAAALIGASWGFAPSRFEIGGGRLRIRRVVFGSKEFAVQGPATPWDKAQFRGIRLGGAGGAFGWYGRFWRRDIRTFWAYVTNLHSLVAVPTDRGIVVVSPAERERFMRALEAAS